MAMPYLVQPITKIETFIAINLLNPHWLSRNEVETSSGGIQPGPVLSEYKGPCSVLNYNIKTEVKYTSYCQIWSLKEYSN